MSDPSLNIDPALLAEFIDESTDMLESVDELFVALEEQPGNLDLIQAIFRPVHSVKGNSAFFGFSKVKALAHEAETLLDMLRKGTLPVTGGLISVLLQAIDELKAMFARARQGGPEVADAAAFEALLEEVRAGAAGQALAPGESAEKAAQLIQALRDALPAEPADWRARCEEALGALKPLLPAEQSKPEKPAPGGGQPLDDLLAILAQPIDGQLAAEEAARVDALIGELAKTAGEQQPAMSLTAELRDSYDTFISTVGFDDLLREILEAKAIELLDHRAQVDQAASPQVSESEKDVPPAQPAPGPGGAPPAPVAAAKGQEPAKTMRVSEAHIDNFLSFVGELVVVGDMLGHLQRQLSDGVTNAKHVANFRRINETFTTLSLDLQRSIMSIRRVPVGNLLARAPRIVRDVAKNSGKDMHVNVEGGDVEVDKSLIDLLDAPLTHMVRNAADHGIEPPEVREAAGKPRQGTVCVRVEETGADLVLEVVDDGAGINREALRTKAESLKLVRPGEPLTEEALVSLLFSSGVSTAKKVTDVSGRGVGMDVVKRAIEEAGGVINVQTEEGKGSIFAVRLPKSVTTQILDGFIVEAAGQCFVLPMNRIRETVKVQPEEITTVTGKGQCIKRHGVILPVVDLREVLRLSKRNGAEYSLMVTAEAHRRNFAIVVDGVRGVQQIVVRSLEGLENGMELLTGGALLGDGSVALIIDPDVLSPYALEAAGAVSEEPATAAWD